MRDATMTLPDGRQLAFAEYGPSAAPVVLYFHGNPTSRLDLVSREDDVLSLGVRVIAPDRPGFGGSSFQPDRRLEHWAADVAALADHLSIDQFSVMGLSAGGVYATVSAALLGERVTAVGVVAAPTDPSWESPDPPRHPEDLARLQAGDEAALIADYADRFGADASGFPVGGAGLTAPDVAEFEHPVHSPALYASVRESFRQGIGGLAQDRLVRFRPWTFDISDVTVPAIVAHGEQDIVVPIEHSEHSAEILQNSLLLRFPEHGHLSIMGELPRLAGQLATS